MANLPIPSAVLFVADVERLSEFYRRVAAMTVVHAAKDHAVLEIVGFQLVIHILHGGAGAGSEPVTVREDSYIKLCFPVNRINEARSIASSLGGFIKPARHEWEARGFRACDGHDPEGNVFQVRESLDA